MVTLLNHPGTELRRGSRSREESPVPWPDWNFLTVCQLHLFWDSGWGPGFWTAHMMIPELQGGHGYWQPSPIKETDRGELPGEGVQEQEGSHRKEQWTRALVPQESADRSLHPGATLARKSHLYPECLQISYRTKWPWVLVREAFRWPVPWTVRVTQRNGGRGGGWIWDSRIKKTKAVLPGAFETQVWRSGGHGKPFPRPNTECDPSCDQHSTNGQRPAAFFFSPDNLFPTSHCFACALHLENHDVAAISNKFSVPRWNE